MTKMRILITGITGFVGSHLAELALARGAEVSEIFHEARLGGRFRPVGDADRAPGPATGRQTYSSFLSFDDPDGNGWIVQEITSRLPGRE